MDYRAPTERWGEDSFELDELCAQVLSSRNLILVSNRGPVEHQRIEGRTEARRGSGSVATSFAGLAQEHRFTWVSSAMSEGDREAARSGAAIESPIPGHRVRLRYVTTPRRAYHKYYNVICNPLLWFLQHNLWNPSHNPTVDPSVLDAWETGYVSVCEAFAREVVSEAATGELPPLVMGHDYHLYLLPEFVRRDLPEAIIQHYVHVPWPAPLQWNLIPRHIATRICESLCMGDVVGFQTPQDRRSFMDTVEDLIPRATIDRARWTVEMDGLTCAARVYPGSIDVEQVQQIADTPRARDYTARLLREVGDAATVVRVDRAEPNKNIVRGFRAYDHLLTTHPELKERIKFLAFLVPSRTHLRQYQRYLEEVKQIVQQVNGNHATSGWQPIVLYLENNYTQAIAAMQIYDALLVNTLVEGMNLVAKEGPVVNQRNGSVILSQTSGAHHQLSGYVLPVAPTDIAGTAEALHHAVTMSAEERRRRSAELSRLICRDNNQHWLALQLADIARIIGPA